MIDRVIYRWQVRADVLPLFHLVKAVNISDTLEVTGLYQDGDDLWIELFVEDDRSSKFYRVRCPLSSP